MMSLDDDKQKKHFYGVRKGLYGIKSCVFMSWNDCQRIVEGFDEAEFDVFDKLEDAAEYATMENDEKDHHSLANSNFEYDSDVEGTESKNSLEENTYDEMVSTQKESVENYCEVKDLESCTPMLPPFEDIKIKGDPDLEINLISDDMERKKNVESLEFGKESGDQLKSYATKRKIESISSEPSEEKPSNSRCSTEEVLKGEGRENKAWEYNIKQAQEFLYSERVRLEDDGKSVICCRPNHIKDKKISNWLQRQVVSFKKGNLKISRQERLLNDLEWDVQKAVDFCTCYIFEEKWQEMYHKLCHFYSINGHSNVAPTEHTELSKWVSRQKEEYKKLRQTNKPSKLDLTKIQKLNDVQFPFPKNKGKKYKWEERLEQLKNYKESYGNLKIPRFFDTARFPGLGDWVDTQRYYYDKFFHSPHTFKNANRIPQQQRNRLKTLEDMGLEFPPVDGRRPVSKWEDMLELLKTYKQRHGHLMVPQKEPLLGQWVKGQRKQYNYLKAGKPSNMTEEKVAQLKKVGFEFDGKKRQKSTKKSEGMKKEVDLTQESLSRDHSNDESDTSSVDIDNNSNYFD